MTKKELQHQELARKLGTDAIVIGRSITKAQEPLQAYTQAVEEWKNGTSK